MHDVKFGSETWAEYGYQLSIMADKDGKQIILGTVTETTKDGSPQMYRYTMDSESLVAGKPWNSDDRIKLC